MKSTGCIMLKISVTQLEQFSKLERGATSFDGSPLLTDEKLIEILTAPRLVNHYMLFGSALHSALENGVECVQAKEDNIIVQTSGDYLKSARDYLKTLNTGIPLLREYKMRKVYCVYNDVMQVTGKCDAYYYDYLIEYKTTKRYNLENYHTGMQHVFYMDIFDCNACRYIVFEHNVKSRENEHTFEYKTGHVIDTYRQAKYDKQRINSLLEYAYDFIYYYKLTEHFTH